VHLTEVELWSSSLYQSTFNLPPGTAIQDISISKIVEEFKAAVERFITSAGPIVKTLQNIGPKELQDQLEVAFNELQNEFAEPLPEDKSERYKWQETMITQALEKIEDAIVDVCRTWKIPEDSVRADFGKTKPHLKLQ